MGIYIPIYSSYFIIGSVYLLSPFSHIVSFRPPPSGNDYFVLYIYAFTLFCTGYFPL